MVDDLANVGILLQICNIQINTRPIDGEMDSCLRSGDTLVSFVESTEYICSETMVDVEAAAV